MKIIEANRIGAGLFDLIQTWMDKIHKIADAVYYPGNPVHAVNF